MPDPIRILLVDDHELVRESWKILLDQDKRFEVIGQCSNGEEAITKATILNPDVILMDINMSPINGFEATEKIVAVAPFIRIIGVSANNNPRYATKMLAMGGKGFVTKTSAFEELKTAIQKVFDGEHYLCQEITQKSRRSE